MSMTQRLPLALDWDGDIVDDNGNLIAVITAGKSTYSKLFVAAPDLLEFAKQVVAYANDSNNTYLAAWAQSVVNTAEGVE
jgi:hypothetical protein